MRDSLVLGLLALAVLLLTALEGKLIAGVAFVGFLLVPYGFGKILWSSNARKEWIGWLAIAVGVAILIYLKAGMVALFAVLAVCAQVLARLLGRFL